MVSASSPWRRTSAIAPSRIVVDEVPVPIVGPFDVLVRVGVAALNFRDTKQRRDPSAEVMHQFGWRQTMWSG